MLLNMALTTVQGISGAQMSVWKPFLSCVVERLKENKEPVIFLVWGKVAEEGMASFLGDWTYVLRAPHPSSRNQTSSFIGCRHFAMVNEYFGQKGLPLIDWRLPAYPQSRIINLD